MRRSRIRHRVRCGFAAGLLAAAVTTAAASTADDVAAIVQARVDQVRNGAVVMVAGRALASRFALPDFYERREYRPAWSDGAARDDLLAALRSSASDGLLPRDYHLDVIETLAAAGADDAITADFDLLATDAVIRLAYHLRFGKVDPVRLDPDWNFPARVESAQRGPPGVTLQRWIDARRVAAGIDSLRPQHVLYAGLRAALARYRTIEDSGGWNTLPAGPTLRPGATDARVPRLRVRLAVEGDLAAGAGDSGAVYDSALVAAVRAFQTRHGLAPDGLLGRGTLRHLNVPVATRIAQLRLALESGRLLLHDLPSRLVIVNVPAFRVYYADETGAVLESKVIVGKPFRQTPIFRSEMTSVVINPSWTIPPTILREDVRPGIQRDPDYLQKHGYREIGDQIVQAPGPDNALGRLKLNFPNPHLVYMHDTPAKSLFGADARTFSSGCIRVEKVLDLAVLVLDDPERWSRAQLEAAIATGQTRTVMLRRTLPVLLTYWTAAVGAGDTVYFYDDVYERDAAFLRALDGPFRFRSDVTSRLGGATGER